MVICFLFAVSEGAFQLPIDGAVGAAAALPTVKVECGFDGQIYKNRSRAAKDVTVQATDNCKGFGSEVEVQDSAGDRVGDAEPIPDGGTGTVTFTVPAGGTINFDCSGSEGSCSYTISV
jgi:hypothetical protein